eukprot:gnl/MRDRNA2_/MRDRNA2_35657_c0_seq1.p1 gnl/MRDRNA2_/MRDRNA2_35657_c0~~gnl/MRDRNA2_/MRDRNA2_35657_c0_seq1.p1  ORF type:complete len:891 (-),score=177.29 gnl/MRDRNA2_/MRDRNA2_35657_c0_seq1:60-2732(-)
MVDNTKVGIKALFARLDADGDGFVDRDEFQLVLGQVVTGHLNEEDINRLMGLADKNQDGKLAYSEFLDWLFVEEVRSEMGYLQKYSLQEFTTHLLERLKEEEPDDPYELICEEATSWRVQWKEVNKRKRFKKKKAVVRDGTLIELTAEETQKQEALSALVESISDLLQSSAEITKAVLNDKSENESPWQQDIFYRGAGLEDLLDDAKQVKPVFDDLCTQMVTSIKEKELLGPETKFLAVPIKGYGRAEAKTRVSYLNDASQLTDVVRGTIMLDLPLDAAEKPLETCETVYEILQLIVQVVGDSSGSHLVHFDDRYQRPLGDYRDFLFLVKVHGYICELQLNFDIAIKMKEGYQHREFELKRLANDMLLEAVMTANIAKVESALEAGASARICDRINRLSALHYAAASGDDEMTRQLLDNNADPLATDIEGYLPINRPLLKTDATVSKSLLEYMSAKELVHRYSSLNDTACLALVVACERAMKNGMTEQVEMIDEILKIVFASRGMKAFFCVRGHARTLLHSMIRDAEEGPDPEAEIQKLLNDWFLYRSDIPNGDVTLLDEAVLSGDHRLATLLASKGAQFHPRGPHANPHNAAKYYAQQDQQWRLEALLAVEDQAPRHLDLDVDQGRVREGQEGSIEEEKCIGGEWGKVPGTPLNVGELVEAAVKRKSFKALSVLLDDGNTLPEDDIEGGPALRAAAGVGDEDALRLLLRAGAKIDDCDKNERTALWIGAAGGHASTVLLLCSAKADINKVDSLGRSALAIAAMNLQLECVEALCNSGADFDEMTSGLYRKRKCHPGCIAAANGAVLILQALHNAGLDLSRQVEDNGWTIAHSAAKHSQERVLRFLTENQVGLSDSSVLEEARNSKSRHVRPGAVEFLEQVHECGKEYEF